MRSTVDIADAIDTVLRERAKQQNISYKEMLNRTLAAGLQALDAAREERAEYRVKAKACGFRPGIDINHLNRLADELEDEEDYSGE